jgi:type I restriction enzyme M protein
VDRAHRDWTPAQIGFLANLVRLYRGDALDFTLGGGEAKAKIEEVFGGAHAPSRVVDRAPAGNPERSARARTAAPGAGAIPIEEVFGGAHAPSRVVDRAPAGNPERSARARTAAPGAGAVPIQ